MKVIYKILIRLLITIENTSLIHLSQHDEENTKLGDISIDIASIAEEDAISVCCRVACHVSVNIVGLLNYRLMNLMRSVLLIGGANITPALKSMRECRMDIWLITMTR